MTDQLGGGEQTRTARHSIEARLRAQTAHGHRSLPEPGPLRPGQVPSPLPAGMIAGERFTVCDAYHCSVHGSTNPNRNYLWTGTTGFEPGTTSRAVTNAAYGAAHPGYTWTTYPSTR
ncbi:alkaline phosphatase family protein [Streptomyces sp. MS06]|uniref:alkaline phosphatase family protein n=1 Tax=Streptomyces sp. MS06 TaxID=3385974 RepID=UPI0039A056E8